MPRLINRKEVSLEAKHKAFDYQVEALEFLQNKNYAAVFHEQGLGKTKIAIDLGLYWLAADIIDTVLIVTKKSLVFNWEREVSEHTHIKARILGRSSKSDFYVLNGPARIIVTHYEAIKKEQKRIFLFLKTRRVGIILDESHKIKNPNTDLTKVFFELSDLFKRRVIMTGTPIANRPYDIWSQIKFLDNGESLGNDFSGFKSEYDFGKKLIDSEEAKMEFAESLSSLRDSISDFSIRETKDGSTLELPNKVFRTIITEWEPLQLDKYNSVRYELKLSIIKDGKVQIDHSEDILKRLLRLVQIASNPSMLDDGYKLQPGKFETLLDLLTDIKIKGEKCIVWTSFTRNVTWLKNNLKEFKPATVTGKMSMEQRDHELQRFKNIENVKILIATPGSAKEGLTLTQANHAIFYDRTFSLDDYLQAQDRIHRISQVRECYIYKLLMENSIDYWVDQLLEEKILAAKLGQGDIDQDEYIHNAEYKFYEILEKILDGK